MIHIELTTRIKRRNSHEYRKMPMGVAEGIELASDGPILPRLCALLIEAGHDPSEECEVWRGSTLCFHAKPIGQWASGKGLKMQEQPEHLKKREVVK